MPVDVAKLETQSQTKPTPSLSNYSPCPHTSSLDVEDPYIGITSNSQHSHAALKQAEPEIMATNECLKDTLSIHLQARNLQTTDP